MTRWNEKDSRNTLGLSFLTNFSPTGNYGYNRTGKNKKLFSIMAVSVKLFSIQYSIMDTEILNKWKEV